MSAADPQKLKFDPNAIKKYLANQTVIDPRYKPKKQIKTKTLSRPKIILSGEDDSSQKGKKKANVKKTKTERDSTQRSSSTKSSTKKTTSSRKKSSNPPKKKLSARFDTLSDFAKPDRSNRSSSKSTPTKTTKKTQTKTSNSSTLKNLSFRKESTTASKKLPVPQAATVSTTSRNLTYLDHKRKADEILPPHLRNELQRKRPRIERVNKPLKDVDINEDDPDYVNENASAIIQKMFGRRGGASYNMYDDDSDDSTADMEAGWDDLEDEEEQSELFGRREDVREMKKEVMRKRQKRAEKQKLTKKRVARNK